jgi:hypothetical protein
VPARQQVSPFSVLSPPPAPAPPACAPSPACRIQRSSSPCPSPSPRVLRRRSPPQGVPTNDLHACGYISIGCEPCTRPVLPNQHEREGRWWWEDATAVSARRRLPARLSSTAAACSLGVGRTCRGAGLSCGGLPVLLAMPLFV